MSNIKQTIMAAAVAVACVTTAQADGLSDSLPLGKSLAAGHELPLPLGISANVFFLEQDLVAQSIAVDIPPLPLPTGPLQLPPGLPAKSDKLESRATSTTAKLDAWLLPFLNVYAVAGYVDGETSASGFSVGGLPPELASLLPSSFSIAYNGPVYGGGITLAAGYNQFFASLDANYTESDLDIGDSSIEAIVISPRVGITGDLGGLSGSLYVGAMYQDVDEHQNGTVKFPVMGMSVPVGYDVISEAEEKWNYLIGANLKASESWNYGIEVGFSGRTHVMATLNYRF
ncbi:MAG: hypothetical protein DSZ35_06335 [Verrucomicrobia bacterium]|nr:MAG: hypothetical protein DSZ35_06335 [Verrucomicrobiota bacterium]